MSVSSPASGILDTNVVVHSLVNDSSSEECRRFLAAVREGILRVSLEPLVVHELTYVLTKTGPKMSSGETASYIQSLLMMKGVEGDSRAMMTALDHWQQNPSIGFVDCYLAAKSQHTRAPVSTKNIRHVRQLGVDVPDPLPG